MLFNTFPFFVIFLPIALLGYFLISRHSLRLSIVWLLAASLVFYAQWNIGDVPLIIGSFAANFAFGQWISRDREAGRERRARRVLAAGLAFNLLLLGGFKYLDFLVANIDALTGAALSPPGIVLPLGISFFTFTQVAYLVDCHRRTAREYRIENYAVFVTYFPHLIAGPILHHRDMMPQFESPAAHVFVPGRLVLGMMFFDIGLIKKVVLADGLARFVGPVFDAGHAHLAALDAWCGALAYTFQLYFDFSAYSDMAYGMSLMFGIVLPLNFNSPYQARSIIDFWRRWHITLSSFLRNYLYIPLGGNRHGRVRRYLNLMITMLLGGLWHGASWTFVAWGGLHGAYLAINHALRHLFGERRGRVISLTGWLSTFVAVVIGWVFFRAPSISVALDVLQAMFAWPGPAGSLAATAIVLPLDCLAWLAVAAGLAFLAPNAFELIGWGPQPAREQRLGTTRGALLLGALWLLAIVVLAIGEARGAAQFLYFNF